MTKTKKLVDSILGVNGDRSNIDYRNPFTYSQRAHRDISISNCIIGHKSQAVWFGDINLTYCVSKLYTIANKLNSPIYLTQKKGSKSNKVRLKDALCVIYPNKKIVFAYPQYYYVFRNTPFLYTSKELDKLYPSRVLERRAKARQKRLDFIQRYKESEFILKRIPPASYFFTRSKQITPVLKLQKYLLSRFYNKGLCNAAGEQFPDWYDRVYLTHKWNNEFRLIVIKYLTTVHGQSKYTASHEAPWLLFNSPFSLGFTPSEFSHNTVFFKVKNV